MNGAFLWSHALWDYVREFLLCTAMTRPLMYACMYVHVPIYVCVYIHSTYVYVRLKMYIVDRVGGKSNEWVPLR